MMSQAINLYLPEFRLQKPWLDGAKALQLLTAVLVLLLNVSAFTYWKSYTLTQDLSGLEKQHQDAVANTLKMTNIAGNRSADVSLDARNVALEKMLEGKQALLNFMQGKTLGNAKGFSPYLTDLARYHTQGLSLEHISLKHGGGEVKLGGQVLRAELVPLYLQNLSQGTSFNGKSFQTLGISEVPAKLSSPQALGVSGAPELWHFSVATGFEE